MKRIVTFALALVMLTMVLTGCNFTKDYTCQNLSMSIPSYLKDVSDDPQFSKFTFALDSSKMAVFGTREALKNTVTTLEEYADLVAKGNNYDSKDFNNNGSYIHYEYSANVDGETFNYIVGLFDGGDAYWMIQIASPTGKFDRSKSLEILDSVKFS